MSLCGKTGRYKEANGLVFDLSLRMKKRNEAAPMRAELKPMYDYQWELTLMGAQLDERILRCPCSGAVEAAVRGHCRKMIITASDIKYGLISLDQALSENTFDSFSEEEKAGVLTEALQQMERSLYLLVKDYVNLMASFEGEAEAEAARNVLKEFWPKMAEVYQYFKAILMEVEAGTR